VANLAHLALATVLYSRINNLSYKQRNQIGKIFEGECLNAKEFFTQFAQGMKGNISCDRVDFIKEGTAWIDDTDRWLHANWCGHIDLDTWNDLVRRLYSLIEVHNVLWAISIECFKSVEANIRAKLFKTKKEHENATGKCWRRWTWIKKIPRWIYVLVIFLASLLTCIYFLWWLWTIFWKR